MRSAQLEIALFRSNSEDYTVTLRYRAPQSMGEADLLGGHRRTVQLDQVDLLVASADPDAYSRQLTAALFTDPEVRGAFREARAAASALDVSLRIALRFEPSAAELHRHRWEMLRDPQSGDWLHLSERLLISRVLDSSDLTPVVPKGAGALRAAVVVASPDDSAAYGLAPIDVAAEVARARGAFGGIPTTVHARTEPGTRMSSHQLAGALRDGPDILYLMAHGRQVDGETHLWLEGDDGGGAWLPGEELVRTVERLPRRPLLVILAACQTAGVSQDGDALAALGPRLAAAGVAAVIAMQGDLAMDTAAVVLPALLRELLRDGLVDRALAVARAAVRDREDWWRPVLFLRLRDGRLFEPAVLPKPPCPYPGLAPFCGGTTAEPLHPFFGRELEIEELTSRVQNSSHLLVIGPSGSGKSSLLQAGLIPRLTGASSPEGRPWLVRTVRLASAPLEALVEALGGDIDNPPETVRGLLARQPETVRVLLIIDQLEELFALADRASQRRFCTALLALQKLPAVSVILAMRADFYGELMLSELWETYQNRRFEVTPLRGEALRRAILKPAEAVGVTVEAALLERLVADASDEPGALPLLQETMRLLWSRMQGRHLTSALYESLAQGGRSGLSVAVATHADATLTALAELGDSSAPGLAGDAVAQRILLRLVQFGEGRPNTRRRQRREELRDESVPAALFTATLQTLIESRLITASSEGATDAVMIDIAHEALIAGWPRLLGWLEERGGAEQMRRRLRERALDALGRNRNDGGGLLDAADLAAAEDWQRSAAALALGRDTEVESYILRSRAHQERLAAERERVDHERWVASERIRAQGLALQALSVAQDRGDTELALLLAHQAHLANQRSGGGAEDVVDRALRSLLSAPYFRTTISGRRAVFHPKERRLARIVDAGPGFERRVLLHSLDRPSPPPLHLEGLRLDGAMELAFHPSGDLVAVTSTDGLVIWSLRGPSPRRHAHVGSPDRISAPVFSPDGTTLVGVTGDGTLLLWEVRRLDAEPRRIELGTHSIRALAIGADGSIAAGGPDGNVWTVNFRHPERSPAMLSAGGEQILGIAFHPSGERLAAGGRDGNVYLWPWPTTSPEPEVLSAERQVRSVAFSPDGAWLAAGCELDYSAHVRLWGPGTKAPVLLRCTADGMPEVSFSADSRLLAAASGDSITIWHLAPHRAAERTLQGVGSRRLPGPTSAVSADGAFLAVVRDERIERWRTAIVGVGDSEPVSVEVERPGPPLALSSDGATLIAGQIMDSGYRRWDLRHPQRPPMPLPLPEALGFLLAVAVSPTGEHVAAAEHNRIAVWKIDEEATEPLILQCDTSVHTLVFSPDGRSLGVSMDQEGATTGMAAEIELRIWSLEATTTAPVRHVEVGRALAVHASSGRMAASSQEGVAIWHWGDFTAPLCTIPLRGGQAQLAAWSPDSRLLAVVVADGMVEICEPARPAAPTQLFRAHDRAISVIGFADDSETLVVAANDGQVRLTLARTESLVEVLCELVGRNLTPVEWRQYIGTSYAEAAPIPGVPFGPDT